MMRAISRLERLCSKCSRRTSWILRMDNLLLVKQPSGKYREVATVIPLPPAHSGRVKLSSLARNQCPVCAGTGVQFAVESVSSLAWNGCPVWRGKRITTYKVHCVTKDGIKNARSSAGTFCVQKGLLMVLLHANRIESDGSRCDWLRYRKKSHSTQTNWQSSRKPRFTYGLSLCVLER